MGKDGAYGSGSHKTGFVGVYDAATSKTTTELVAILKGSANAKHDFSSVMDEASIDNLAAFLKEGVFDMTPYVDKATKKPKAANAANGKTLFEGTCAACHGKDGRTLNFGTDEEPEYIGTLANDNPWEFLHKVKFGQPGTAMPAGVISGWSIQQVVDVLAHAQTLPEGKEVAAAPTTTPAPAIAPPPTGSGGLDASPPLSELWQALGILLAASALGAGVWTLRRHRS